MVALGMASTLVKGSYVTTEEILTEARERGLSKQGEMFSAFALQELAAHFLSSKVECLHLQHSETTHCLDGKNLANQLINRNLVLIPYDSDKNHSPCQKRGHKAHWALLTGIFVAVKASDMTEELLSNCRREPDVPMLYYWPDDPGPVLCDQLSKLVCEKAEDLFVLGHHGKSKYAGLWPLKDLLLSNDNLLETGPDRSLEDYVIPPGGVEAGLRSRFITINMKS
uniref:Actin maturation protease n=1 Tax=Arion vulgaris TaxID=1028688 RepID=A0A0B7A1R4_9EUPU